MTHTIYAHDSRYGAIHLAEVETYIEAMNVVLQRAQGRELAPLHAPAVAAIQRTGRPLQAWKTTDQQGECAILYIT